LILGKFILFLFRPPVGNRLIRRFRFGSLAYINYAPIFSIITGFDLNELSAMAADSDSFGYSISLPGYGAVSGFSGFGALGAVDHQIGGVYGSLFLDDSAFLSSFALPGMFLDKVNSLHDCPVLLGENLQHFSGFSFVVSCNHNNRITFFDLHILPFFLSFNSIELLNP
jgi:hypothetical protein